MTKNSSRRTFLKTATIAAGSVGAIGMVSCKSDTSTSQQEESEDVNSNDLKLTVAGYNVNRVKSIVNGKVKIKGCSISFVKAGIGDMNTNTFSGEQSYDITEIGLHPYMLAYANDLSYEDVFAEQLKNFFEPGDLVIGVSGSGNSGNVLKAIEYANGKKGTTVGLCGYSGGKLYDMVDIPILVKIDDMQKVEDVHMIVVHMSMQRILEKLQIFRN